MRVLRVLVRCGCFVTWVDGIRATQLVDLHLQDDSGLVCGTITRRLSGHVVYFHIIIVILSRDVVLRLSQKAGN
jgi:hypothetical protein